MAVRCLIRQATAVRRHLYVGSGFGSSCAVRHWPPASLRQRMIRRALDTEPGLGSCPLTQDAGHRRWRALGRFRYGSAAARWTTTFSLPLPPRLPPSFAGPPVRPQCRRRRPPCRKRPTRRIRGPQRLYQCARGSADLRFVERARVPLHAILCTISERNREHKRGRRRVRAKPSRALHATKSTDVVAVRRRQAQAADGQRHEVRFPPTPAEWPEYGAPYRAPRGRQSASPRSGRSSRPASEPRFTPVDGGPRVRSTRG